MAYSLSIGLRRYRLRTREERFSVAFPDVCKTRAFADAWGAEHFLRQALGSSYGGRDRLMSYLRRVTAMNYGLVDGTRLRDHDVVARAARSLVAGRLVVEELSRMTLYQRGAATVRPVEEDAPPPEETPAASTQQETKWIRFRVVDDETDKPMANVKLSLTLSDGSQQKASTNADGIVYLNGLPDGTCDVVSIDYDETLEVRSIA